MRQSNKVNTIKTTKPVSLDPITTIKQITEDASAFATVDGVKQKNGVAYCDGSTLDNTSGKYNDFLAVHGNLVLPNGPFRTNEIAFTFNNTPTGWDVDLNKGYAYCGIDGQWRLKFQIRATITSTSGITDVGIDGVDFLNSTFGFDQAITVTPAPLVTVRGWASPSNNRLRIDTGASSNTLFMVEGDVLLDSKPTWADANLESYPVINLQTPVAAGALGLPPATDTEAGTVSYYNRVDLVLDNEFTGGTRDITVERIGNTVTITGHGTASHAANATPETSAGFIPSWARPRVTTENVYALEPGRVNAVYVEADGTLSCNYKTWTGADSNAGNVGANRTINIQYNVEE